MVKTRKRKKPGIRYLPNNLIFPIFISAFVSIASIEKDTVVAYETYPFPNWAYETGGIPYRQPLPDNLEFAGALRIGVLSNRPILSFLLQLPQPLPVHLA